LLPTQPGVRAPLSDCLYERMNITGLAGITPRSAGK